MTDSDGRLGEKIRELRKARGLTQKELAGERITRNMLSLIESGSASPSVPTLIYLAERLGVPAGFFIPRDASEEEMLFRLTFIGELREAFAQRDWQKCVSLCPALTEPDDEISYILACAHLGLAYKAGEDFNVTLALSELETAEKVARESVYCGESFSASIVYYRHLYSYLCTDEIPAELCDPSGCGENLSYEIVAYFIALKSLRAGEDSAFPFPHTAHREEHLKALEFSMDEEYVEAIRRLRRLADDSSLPCYMRYRVLCDLETAADLSGNVRLAYSTSRLKLNLITKSRSAGIL